ncbi:MAG: hypothetical protein DMG06_05110 [Acidobacteria bacterium]|nr:MAG: hypothetical protein DMG06_05110 [Acidobacteriota bacterium]
MSQRPPVDRQRIEEFLLHLSQRYSRPARIYLVRGTTMVFEGFRTQTLDIDLAFEVARENHGALIKAIRELKDELSLNVEEASPGDFIPLPSGYQERSQFIGRYNQIDVFHFDLYTMALSKIERGTEEDFSDVLLLLRSECGLKELPAKSLVETNPFLSCVPLLVCRLARVVHK